MCLTYIWHVWIGLLNKVCHQWLWLKRLRRSATEQKVVGSSPGGYMKISFALSSWQLDMDLTYHFSFNQLLHLEEKNMSVHELFYYMADVPARGLCWLLRPYINRLVLIACLPIAGGCNKYCSTRLQTVTVQQQNATWLQNGRQKWNVGLLCPRVDGTVRRPCHILELTISWWHYHSDSDDKDTILDILPP